MGSSVRVAAASLAEGLRLGALATQQSLPGARMPGPPGDFPGGAGQPPGSLGIPRAAVPGSGFAPGTHGGSFGTVSRRVRAWRPGPRPVVAHTAEVLARLRDQVARRQARLG